MGRRLLETAMVASSATDGGHQTWWSLRAVHLAGVCFGLATLFFSATCAGPGRAARDIGADARAITESDALHWTELVRLELEGIETLSLDPATGVLLGSAGADVAVCEFGDPAGATVERIDLARRLGRRASVTHVVADPAARGFAVATLVPDDRASGPGWIAFVDTRTLEVIVSFGAGWHPDAAAISPSGRWLVVANEGEWVERDDGSVHDPPGSVSIVDLAGVESAADCAALGSDAVRIAFPDAALRGVRHHAANRHAPILDLEPEYVACGNDRAYVTLQENNAIGVVDLATARWMRIETLDTVERRMDACADGELAIEDVVQAMPMPDQAALATLAGRPVLLTADEGDQRGRLDRRTPSPRADAAPIGWLERHGGLRGRTSASLSELRASAPEAEAGQDTAGARAFGARSVSVLDAQTLERLGDTGAQLEFWMARTAPELFNAHVDESGVDVDARSVYRGPEPEGLAVASLPIGTCAFVTLERPGAIACVVLDDPAAPRVASLHVAARHGDLGPEGIAVVRSDADETVLAVAFEKSGTLVLYSVRTAATP